MARTSLLTFICLTTLAFTACSAAKNATLQSQVETLSEPPAMNNRTGSGAGGAATAEKVSLEQADQSQNRVAARKIICNANLTLEAGSPEEASQKIAQIAESKSGFVVTRDTRTAGDANSATNTTINLVLRVPAEQFDQAIGEIRQVATRVTAEKIAGQDVTEEFIDLEARINAKRALEAQFLEIMKQSRAVSDALEVQKQLAEVRGEIESLEGRRKFLENQTSLSTINITLNAPAVFAANSTGFLARLTSALSDGINAALDVLLFLIRAFLALLPLIILLGVPLYLFTRYLRKKSRRQKMAQQFAQNEKD